MNIKSFIKENTKGQVDFAERIGVSQSMVSHWIRGWKRVSAERAIQISRKTEGKVSTHELRPDLFDPPSD